MSMKKSASATQIGLDSSGLGGSFTWHSQSHGSLTSPSISAPKIPNWLRTSSLQKRRYLSKSTGNLHGLRNQDYLDISWLLPKMFGDEKYAYQLIDIEDPRYLKEVSVMGRKLTKLFYDMQIIDERWRETYKMMLNAEHRRRTLPKNPSAKSMTALDTEVSQLKGHLLELQEQKDLYDVCVAEIWTRCDQIKAVIKKENDLESLRQELSDRVKAKFDSDDPFWTTPFNARSPQKKGSFYDLGD